MITKMSKGYQITIPAKWRHMLGIEKGSNFNIEINNKKKQIIIEPIEGNSFDDLFEEAKKYPNKLSPKELSALEDESYE
ncbi:MAG: AbrB/MazE/SpoVT family DNA-binding domain-containing protein [Candidatus Woesearchaeota archaeon]